MAIDILRPQLDERRRQLKAAAGRTSLPNLSELLAEVDAALERIDLGTYGLCETCHDAIEPDRLRVDPLIRFCLDHLSPQELRAHEQDLELATRIQYKLLPPRELAIPGWQTHYHYQSAGPVGGDFCELAPVDDGRALFFAVGDVAGKGVAASLLMTHLSAILRSLLSLRLSTLELMVRANRLFCEGTLDSHYATLVCGLVREEGVELSNAGHCAPLVTRGNGVQRLDISGLPLGLFCKSEYLVTHITLDPGESLVLYTDGVVEARDSSDAEFGESRLMSCLGGVNGTGAQGLVAGVLNDLDRFRGAAGPVDDLTLLAILRER